MTTILHQTKIENPVTPEFNTSVSPRYNSPSDKKSELSDLESPSSRSDRSSTPSSTTSTAATSVSDASELNSKTTTITSLSLPSPKSSSSSSPSSAPTPIPAPSSQESLIVPTSKPVSVKKEKKDKKEKREKRLANRALTTASGISTTVPVSGERPKPTSHPTLDDNVLMAIFEILYDHDKKAEGMTVKQICDILIERHPEMANLSSKTSNLVSAKLNAYVKRVEKGDQNIIYALSRDWADASPKRMVYVYRGLLSKDFPKYVQKVLDAQRAMLGEENGDVTTESDSATASTTSHSKKTHKKAESVPSGNYSASQGIAPSGLEIEKRSSFMDGSVDFRIPQLSIPYSSAPVTASLNSVSPPANEQEDTTMTDASDSQPGAADVSQSRRGSKQLKHRSISKAHFFSALHDDDFDSGNDSYESLHHPFMDSDEESELYTNNGYYRRGSLIIREKIPSTIGKRSKSMSFIQSKKPKTSHNTGIVTAAAATPRLPRKHTIANSSSAAAAVAALRAAALNHFNSPVTDSCDSVNSITKTIMTDTSVEPSISMKWLETVRSGFLTQEIGNPEDISLAELDNLFD
ncbi:unnamed protein product [Ambrosiozyma monospora]|uniref:Unnamed protein product n=1 Tax=Ambrosiozyma monospora TaxID=43982 RepID=A0A9W6YPN7_AMBMO|nr:unnamed protein product [Ambrosiozyma monospora]